MYQRSNDVYQQQAVTTASPAQLVLMCYDGVLAAVTRARQGDREVRNRELQRAQAILTELQVTLDHEQGGDIARNLDGLYGFCIAELVKANVSGDLTDLDGVVDVVAELREAWHESCCSLVAV
jgi:flagellar secretion chaperone FliS